MEILQNFGVDWVLLVAQVINFLLVLFLLKKFLYKPLLSTIRTREETIKRGLKEAKEARELLEKAEEKEKKLIQKAQETSKELIQEAKDERVRMLQQAEEQTRKQTEAMLSEAKAQISEDIVKAEKQLSANITTLAVHVLEKSISDIFSEDEQDVVMKKAIKKLKSN